jgi:hypothetical protein
MSLNPHGVRNDVQNVDALKRLQQYQANNVQHLLDSAVTSGYILDKEQFETAVRVFAPRQIKIVAPAAHVSHPVAALLNSYANQQCIAEGKRFNKPNERSQVIDIGGSPLRTPAQTHMCALINDMRTDSRYTESAFNQLNTDDTAPLTRYDMRSYLNKEHEHCTGGAERCHYKALYAYAVNVYDISMENIAKIFDNHDLLVMDVDVFANIAYVYLHQ